MKYMGVRDCFEQALLKDLGYRREKGLLRTLPRMTSGVDFCSNDYLGFARMASLRCAEPPDEELIGATGSRLISGNSKAAEVAEKNIATFHHAEAALIFTSGYVANIGLLSCIAAANDLLILDSYCHASLMDGARMSRAIRLKFRHNDLADLEKKLQYPARTKFVVIESVYSMHGDEAPIGEVVSLCKRHHALLLVDEAHATGIYGKKGEGMVCDYGLAHDVYARVHTFGKALGLHGAAIVGSRVLCDYLINYARSFVYTTALPPALYQRINKAYTLLPLADRAALRKRIDHFITLTDRCTRYNFIKSTSPIQGIAVGDNKRSRSLAAYLQKKGFFVKAILSPTVPKGDERIRICLHSFNTEADISSLFVALEEKPI